MYLSKNTKKVYIFNHVFNKNSNRCTVENVHKHLAPQAGIAPSSRYGFF